MRDFPATKKCFECGGEAKHQGRPYDYPLTVQGRLVKIIPMVMDEGVYKCQDDDCGIIWDENEGPNT